MAISSVQTIWSMRFTASFSSTKLSDPATEPMFGNSSFAHSRLPPFLLVEMEQYRVLNIFPRLDLQNEQFQNGVPEARVDGGVSPIRVSSSTETPPTGCKGQEADCRSDIRPQLAMHTPQHTMHQDRELNHQSAVFTTGARILFCLYLAIILTSLLQGHFLSFYTCMCLDAACSNTLDKRVESSDSQPEDKYPHQ